MSTSDKNTSQQLILARMAATRAELIAANHVSSLIADSRRGGRSPVVQEGPIFLQSPYAQMISVALVASVVLGPGHVVKAVVSRVLVPWVTYTVRSLFRR